MWWHVTTCYNRLQPKRQDGSWGKIYASSWKYPSQSETWSSASLPSSSCQMGQWNLYRGWCFQPPQSGIFFPIDVPKKMHCVGPNCHLLSVRYTDIIRYLRRVNFSLVPRSGICESVTHKRSKKYIHVSTSFVILWYNIITTDQEYYKYYSRWTKKSNPTNIYQVKPHPKCQCWTKLYLASSVFRVGFFCPPVPSAEPKNNNEL